MIYNLYIVGHRISWFGGGIMTSKKYQFSLGNIFVQNYLPFLHVKISLI